MTQTLVPNEGEYLVRDGVIHPIHETELTELDEEYCGYLVWVPREEDGSPRECGQ